MGLFFTKGLNPDVFPLSVVMLALYSRVKKSLVCVALDQGTWY